MSGSDVGYSDTDGRGKKLWCVNLIQSKFLPVLEIWILYFTNY